MVTATDIREFNSYLQTCTDAQVAGVYEKERLAGRDDYAALAEVAASTRGIDLPDIGLPEEEEEEESQFINFYWCPRCNHDWEDAYSCMVDDDCPECGYRHISPYKSEDA